MTQYLIICDPEIIKYCVTELSFCCFNGFRNIIALLHPQIPFEKHLLNKEKSAVYGTGVTLHSLPLKPFVSRANEKNLDKLAKLIKDHPNQKYYIHCYLGKHRVTYAKARVLRMLGRKTRVQKPTPIPKNLLRGNVSKLGKGVYFGPAPNDEEVFDLYSSRIRTIFQFSISRIKVIRVSLRNSADSASATT